MYLPNKNRNNLIRLVILTVVFSLHIFNMLAQDSSLKDTISNNPISPKSGYVSVYPDKFKDHNKIYNWAWGVHYRKLYYEPVRVQTVELDSLNGGLSFVRQMPELYGLLFQDKLERYYLLKTLGSSTSFEKSKFFRGVYDKKSFKDTYLGDFIREANTIENPFSFLISDNLAKNLNLNSGNTDIYHISNTQTDTIVDGTLIKDKLVSIYQLPELGFQNVVTNVDSLLIELHKGDRYIDKEKYVRSRLFDMLVGDWNKTPENWGWFSPKDSATNVYEPMVLDRSHAFTKVDGVFFRQLINMLGLNFITGYDYEIKDVKKFNKLGYGLDMALTADCDESFWLKQAEYIKNELTDELIDQAFSSLPDEIRDGDSDEMKDKLKVRRDALDETARKYYQVLQKYPVIVGSKRNQNILIDDDQFQNLSIKIYDQETNLPIFEKEYNPKQTKEIWLYTLGGADTINVTKKSKDIVLYLIGGTGTNVYNITEGKRVNIYDLKSEKQKLDSLSNAKVVIPREEDALEYDYQKSRYTQFSFTPIGVYDSDLGLNIGTSVAYTIYGFRRAPFSRQHQLSYNYSSGFTYQGIFPDYDSRRSFHLSAFVGSSAYFSNFFGFGNDTDGYKHQKNDYNRVHLNKYALTPAFYYTISKEQEISLGSSFQVFKVDNPKDRDRFVNVVYADDNDIFKTKTFVDLGFNYTLDKKMDSFVSSLKVVFNSGWTINLGDPARNFPYAALNLGVNLKLTDRLTLATLMKGRALFTNKYEFYQSATTELRGFRSNRFIGKQSLYEYTDLRFDMGRLENPFTPLNYGLFLGIDHGRVWYPGEDSNKWHTSSGGGFWVTIFKQFTGKFSYFVSKDDDRFMFQLGLIF